MKKKKKKRDRKFGISAKKYYKRKRYKIGEKGEDRIKSGGRRGNKEKKRIQKRLISLSEEEELKIILKELGDFWTKNEDNFGYGDKADISLFGTVRDFRKNFFKQFNLKDFKKVSRPIKLREVKNGENYFNINGTYYDSYYLQKAMTVIINFRIFQHKSLDLLFLRNKRFGFLICPVYKF